MRIGKESNKVKRQGPKVSLKNEPSKADRQNAATIAQKAKRISLQEKSRSFSVHGAPKNVVIIPFGTEFDSRQVLKALVARDDRTDEPIISEDIYCYNFKSTRFIGSTINFIPCDMNLLNILAASLIADFVIFALSPSHGMDSWCEQVQSALRVQGLPSMIPLIFTEAKESEDSIQGVSSIKKEWKTYFDTNYGKKIDVFASSIPANLLEIERRICQQQCKEIHWVHERPHLVALETEWLSDEAVLRVRGHVRGKPFLPHRKVYLSMFNEDFTIKNCYLLDRQNQKTSIERDPSLLDIEEENESNAEMDDLSEENIDSNDERQSDEEMTDDEMSCSNSEEDEAEVESTESLSDLGDEEDIDFIDDNLREKLKSYKGLKSFRHGTWDAFENLPKGYSRLVHFQNIKASAKKALNEPLIIGKGAVSVGQKIELQLSGFSLSQKETLEKGVRSLILVFGLLKYEDRISVIHFNSTRYPMYDQVSLASNRIITILCGYRRYTTKLPLFSEAGHGKLNRYLPTVESKISNFIGSFYGQVMFGNPPVMLLYQNEALPQEAMPYCHEPIALMSTGSVFEMNPMKLIIKRKSLFGDPSKVHRQSAVVRNMFSNPLDVKYFQPIQLVTKSGKFGHIKESLGTHGAMKCTFDKPIQQHDTVFIHLYKRIFPTFTE